MVSSIRKFAQELGSTHVIKRHVERRRTQTLNNSVNNEYDFNQLRSNRFQRRHKKLHPAISAPFDQRKHDVAVDFDKGPQHQKYHRTHRRRPLKKGIHMLRKVGTMKPKIQLLREEKDRFDAMREIQRSTSHFKRYSALGTSVIACECIHFIMSGYC